MREYLVGNCIKYIQKNKSYSNTKISEIKYGLESIYLTFSKLIILIILSLILGITKEMLIYLLVYNIIRIPSFGIHATKSWICLLSSSILFIGVPCICKILSIPLFLKYIINIINIIFIFKNSPADTYKRPIVSKKRRKIYKTISVIIAIIFSLLSIFIKNRFVSNCFIFSLIMQNFMIAPTIYKIFGLPYNNYIDYLKKHPELSQ